MLTHHAINANTCPSVGKFIRQDNDALSERCVDGTIRLFVASTQGGESDTWILRVRARAIERTRVGINKYVPILLKIEIIITIVRLLIPG